MNDYDRTNKENQKELSFWLRIIIQVLREYVH